MHGPSLRFDRCIEGLEEGDEVLRTVLLLETSDDLARCHVERREEVERAVTDIVVGLSFRLTEVHRQDRLRTFERLDLRLFVHREDDSAVGWVHIEAYDVANFLDELRVVWEFEGAHDVWLRGQTSARSS